jgi:VWFA-related protein
LIAVAVASAVHLFAQIRTGVVLVPLDVRVVDRNGDPVTDLVATDFMIMEDGFRQELAHFATQSYVDQAPVDPASPLAGAVTPQRVFLIVLGRGQLNAPVKALDAVIDFVRSHTLPGDRVGVFAYQRATEMKTDREPVARLLERFRERHAAIEAHIASFIVRGSGAGWLSPETRALIDALFEGPGLPSVQLLPGGASTLSYAYDDSSYLLGAIEYLRHTAGEKQLVFLSERPFPLAGLHDRPSDHHFVRLATGARVALSFINTGGVPGQFMRRGRLSRGGGIDAMNMLAAGDHRVLAEQTGGTMTVFYQDARKPLANLDRVTRFQYLLAYYPTNAKSDNHQRTVQVLVKPGLTLSYRHGYQPRPLPSSPEDLRLSITEGRIAEIVSYLRTAGETRKGRLSKLAGVVVSRSPGDTQIKVRVSFDASRIYFEKRADAYVGDVDLAVVVDDANEELLTQKVERLAFELSPADYARTLGTKREWLEATLTIDIKGEPAYLRVVVFEYESGWFSSDSIRLRR